MSSFGGSLPIVEFSDDAIVSKNLDGVITSWNKGAERLFGYLAEEVIGRPVTVLIPLERHPEESVIVGRIRRDDRIEHYETVRRRKDGSLIDVSLAVSPMRDAEGKIIGASKIARDITERKRSEAQISALAHEAEHRAKNALALHELATNVAKYGALSVPAGQVHVEWWRTAGGRCLGSEQRQ